MNDMTMATHNDNIEYIQYKDETMLPEIQALVARDLSEPYSIFTYRYFLHNWPHLSICAYSTDPENPQQRLMIGTVIGKAEIENGVMQGYIAMLAVDSRFRGRGIGSALALQGIHGMIHAGCQEILLETEVTNQGALRLYTKLGFFKDDYMSKYYLNGNDAYRLKLWIDRPPVSDMITTKLVPSDEKDGYTTPPQQV